MRIPCAHWRHNPPTGSPAIAFLVTLRENAPGWINAENTCTHCLLDQLSGKRAASGRSYELYALPSGLLS
jgi:hypothetical protein